MLCGGTGSPGDCQCSDCNCTRKPNCTCLSCRRNKKIEHKIEELKKALKKYGTHKVGCHKKCCGKCDCGLDEANA